jgi:hypothetical protein
MTAQKIFYVWKPNGEFAGYVVSITLEEATRKAALMLSLPESDLRVEDTGKTKPKCCPRR